MSNDNEQLTQAINDLVRQLKSSSGVVGAGAGSKSASAKDLSESLFGGKRGLQAGINQTSKSFMGLSKNVDSFGTMLMSFGAAGGILGALGGMIDSTTDHYREFLNVGQTFSGSMTNMHVIATESNQSLEQFSKQVKENATVAATLGVQRFGELGAEVRSSAMQFGSFGLTVEQTNEVLGNQLKTQRVLGILDKIDRATAAKNYADLQNQTLGLASVTGKARDSILKMTQDLQQNNAELFGYLGSLPENTRSQVQKSVETAINVFASLPGEVGETLSRGLTEGLAMGSAYLSSTMGELSTMAPQVTKSLERVRQLTEAGASADEIRQASIDTVASLQDLSGAQKRNFAVFAQSGNAAAKQLLMMASNVEGLRLEEMRRAADQEAMFGDGEKTFMNFGQALASVGAQVKGLFMNLIAPTLESFMGKGSVMTTISDALKDLGKKGGPIDTLGVKLKEWFTEGDMLGTIGTWFKKFEEFLIGFDLEQTLSDLMDNLKTMGEFGESMGKLVDKIGAVATVLTVILGAMATFKVVMLGLGAVAAIAAAPFTALGIAIGALILAFAFFKDDILGFFGFGPKSSSRIPTVKTPAAVIDRKSETPEAQQARVDKMVNRFIEDGKITTNETSELRKEMRLGTKVNKEVVELLMAINEKSSVAIGQRRGSEKALTGLLRQAD